MPEAGPENEGLRLRLAVQTHGHDGNTTHAVRLDLINVTNRSITLKADWPYDENTGDFKQYLEAAGNVETFPAIAPWLGQVMADHRSTPQPEYILAANGTLTTQWTASGWQLKNGDFRPLEVQNPVFPSAGLYSVHVTVKVRMTNPAHAVILRSNEQLVPIGGSTQMPKSPLGKVVGADAKAKTAVIDLGSLQRIASGDQFRIRTGMGDFWRLWIVKTGETTAEGYLEPLTRIGPNPTNPNPRFPTPGQAAELIGKN